MQFGGQPTPWSEVEIEGLRLRSVSQILIQEIGAAGPENAEDSARRACGVIQRMADQIVSADARIAELERECQQWRLELRIYRETENKRIAELESALLAERERICAAIKATDDAASACDYMLDSDDCIAVARGELGPSNYEDKAERAMGVGCEREADFILCADGPRAACRDEEEAVHASRNRPDGCFSPYCKACKWD